MIGLLAGLHFTRERLADRTATLKSERGARTPEIAKADKLRVEPSSSSPFIKERR
jgi:hypothetical protein